MMTEKDWFQFPAARGYKTDRKPTGRPKRLKFGIVKYATGSNSPYMLIPEISGIKVADRISYYITDGGIAFRVEKDGRYSVFSNGSATLRVTLCRELEKYAIFRAKDIVTKKIDGGWFVPFSQFKE